MFFRWTDLERAKNGNQTIIEADATLTKKVIHVNEAKEKVENVIGTMRLDQFLAVRNIIYRKGLA